MDDTCACQARRHAEVAAAIKHQIAGLAAGRCAWSDCHEMANGRGCTRIDHCPELSALLRAAQIAADISTEFVHEGRRYRLAVIGELWVFDGEGGRETQQEPLLREGRQFRVGPYPIR